MASAPKPGAPKRTAALREASAAVVQCLYRLVKGCLLHTSANNESVTASSKALIESVLECCRHGASEDVTVLFIGDAVFVNGAILRTSREAHAIAVELGTLLASCNVKELTLARTLSGPDVTLLGTRLADVWRDRSLGARFREVAIPGVTVSEGKVDVGTIEELSPSERVTRTYAAAVMTVRAMLAEVQRGEDRLPRRVKRLAQKIVAHADEDGRLLVSLASQGGPAVDPSTIAVGTAILTVAMARQLTTERVLLANAAMAALLFDAGKARLSAGMGGVTRKLNDDELDLVPASSVVVGTAMGKLHPPARLRGALMFEAWWLRRTHRMGPLYAGRRTATVLSRILMVARAFCELRAAGPEGTLSVDDALQVLMNRATDTTESAFVRLLIGALGVYPAGTMVELSTGELAVVMATPELPMNFARPPVKIMYDRDARLLAEPIDVDLGAPAAGTTKFILRAVHADDQQLRAMRSFVVAATAATRRAAVRDPLREPPQPTARPARESVEERQSPRSRPSPTSPSAASYGRPEASGVHASAVRRPSVELPRTDVNDQRVSAPPLSAPPSSAPPSSAPRVSAPPVSAPPSSVPRVSAPPVSAPAESAPRRVSRDRIPRTDDPRTEPSPPLDRLAVDTTTSPRESGARRDPRLDPDEAPPLSVPAVRRPTPPPLSRGEPASSTRADELLARGATPSPRSVKPSRVDEALARASAKQPSSERLPPRDEPRRESVRLDLRNEPPPAPAPAPRAPPAQHDRTNQVSWQEYAERLTKPAEPTPPPASVRPIAEPTPPPQSYGIAKAAIAKRPVISRTDSTVPPPPAVEIVNAPRAAAPPAAAPDAAAPARAGGERTSQVTSQVNWEQYTDRLAKAARSPEDVAREQRDALLAAFLEESQGHDKKDKR